MYEWIAFLENALNNNFTFSVIFVLGMFHALEPGHGKTLILAYMSGGSMRFTGTIQLILGLIITHFLLFSLIAPPHPNPFPPLPPHFALNPAC